jgi:hypothetical protein
MSVAGIALDASTRNPIVLLRDPSGRRQVPIWIDQAQAQNILAGLSPQQLPRPLSHDLMVAMLNAAGLQLERVIIHSIEDATFRAVLEKEPHRYIAQPTLALSTVPTLVDQGVAPRHVDFRPFVLTGSKGVQVVPGGLTRVALREGSLVVNSSQGGGTKDSFVLLDDQWRQSQTMGTMTQEQSL